MNEDTFAQDEEFKQIMEKQDWVELAAIAYCYYLAYERGVVQVSYTGELIKYLTEDQIVDEQLKTVVASYNPHTTVLAQYVHPQGDIFGEFLTQPSPEIARLVHQADRMNKDGLYYNKNSTKLIRTAEIKLYESILQVALVITEKLNDIIKIPYRRDVLQLAIRLIGQSQTLYHLGSPSVSVVPRLGNRELVVDISSISSIFRTIIDTFLTMHEVFFEPKDENDFEFFHARWMLIGLHNIKKHTPDYIYNVFAPQEVEPLRLSATNRIRNTTQYQTMLEKKKNNHNKTMDALINRNRDDNEWKRIAQSANIDVSAYQKMYSGYSGYVHSDGYTSYKLSQLDAADFDNHVEILLFLVARIVSKMICDFTHRYKEADEIAKSYKRVYPIIKRYGRKVDGD